MRKGASTIAEHLANFDKLPDSAFVRCKVVAALYNVEPVTVWRWAKSGKLPKPTKLSDAVTGFNVGELRAALAKHIAPA